MGLITKAPSWGKCTTSTLDASTSIYGTPVTAAADDTMGTAVSLITALAHDVEYLVLSFNGFFVSAGNGSCLANILIDPAGGTAWSSTPLIPFLIAGQTVAASTSAAIALTYHFPLFVPSGASIGIQAQTAHTADIITGEARVIAYGANKNPGSWWCGQSVTAIGIDSTTSQGTNHTAEPLAAFSAWTNFGSTLSRNCGALQFVAQGTNTDTQQALRSFIFEFGVGGQRIGSPVIKTALTSESGWADLGGVLFHELVAGTQLQVRAAASSTGTPEPIDVAAYAVH